MTEIQFPIEAAHVLMFARAVGDPNPVYSDAARAAAQGLAGVIAPPTFAIAAGHFDPDYEFRPRPGVPWFGSGRNPVSASGGPQPIQGGPSGFHAEEHFVYHRYPKVGDQLRGRERDGETWYKQGRRGGRLSFSEHITEYRDEAGEPVVTARWVTVMTERHVGADEEPPASGRPLEGVGAGSAGEEAAIDRDGEAITLRGRRVVPGQVHEQVVVEDLKRTQIIMYAGASGDFHPFHTDEPYAKAMGMPGTFAHGMLTMGLSGRALTDFVGDGVLADFGAQFRKPVWPGDTLRVRVVYEGCSQRGQEKLARFSLETVNESGEVVLTGQAHSRLGG
jgi:acyl dehydratase